MRRILWVLTVALVIATMLAITAAPAFAGHEGEGRSFGTCQRSINHHIEECVNHPGHNQ